MKRARQAPGTILDYSLSPPSRAVVRRAYRRWRQEQNLPYRCDNETCTLHSAEPQWNGKPIVLTLDHVDGNSKNNRPSNLRLLCPNCDAQLPTRGGKNKGRVQSEGVDSYHLVERDGTHEVKVMLQGVQAVGHTGTVTTVSGSEA
ncbi:MAG: HNH endonuclease signature motif containing protein [Burkholderiales bacterium]